MANLWSVISGVEWIQNLFQGRIGLSSKDVSVLKHDARSCPLGQNRLFPFILAILKDPVHFTFIFT